jgi:hypothetical protein
VIARKRKRKRAKTDKGRTLMENRVEWETDFDRAVARAGVEGKPIFLFFHNPA